MHRLKFEKYEGLGNDFILVDVENERVFPLERVKAWCDRHFGIGADGILLRLPAQSAQADARMIVLNADGSRPEMCGNGLRCFALYLARGAGKAEGRLLIETDAGEKRVEIWANGNQGTVRASLGAARQLGERELTWGGRKLTFTLISTGNPHAIAFSPEQNRELEQLGPELGASIAGGSNVEMVKQEADGSLTVDVWERGVGRSLACGTGAAATAAAAVLKGLCEYDKPIVLTLPGGKLEVTVEAGGRELWLKGPARYVFSGQASE